MEESRRNERGECGCIASFDGSTEEAHVDPRKRKAKMTGHVGGLPISAAGTPAISGDMIVLAGTDLYGDSELVELPPFDELLVQLRRRQGKNRPVRFMY
jgi:hypothetical protein